MKRSLEDFRKTLIRTMGWGTIIVWMSFALLFQSMAMIIAKNQQELAENRLSIALNAFVSSHEGRVAIISSNPDFRTFLRSGMESREQFLTHVLTLLSSLREENITGISLFDKDQSGPTLASLGTPSSQSLAFDICYIGDQLNAQFGRCAATVVLYFSEEALGQVLSSSNQIRSCPNCNNQLGRFLTPSRFLKISDRTDFPVRFEPMPIKLGTIQFFFILISLLVLGFGIFFRRLVGRSIKEAIVDPLNSLLVQMKSGKHLEPKDTGSIAEVVALHRHNSALSAVAQTTQMLAHDVRKPFGIFQMGLGMLAKAQSMEEIKTISNKLLPEIEKSLSSVNGLISDVMMVGQKLTLNVEKTSLESIIESCLNEAARIHPEARITYKYELQHKHLLKVDSAKVLRLFSNIIGNAIQAVGKHGEIWIKSRELMHEKNSFIEVTLGNNGPAIHENDLAKLFDAFFTTGKSGGTGLGLAIAKEVVTTHGGSIWCESPTHGDIGVQFKLLLPAAAELSHTSAKLHPTHQEIKTAMTVIEGPGERGSVNRNELGLEAEIIHYARKIGGKLSLGILDDEAVYRNWVFDIIARSPALSAVLEFHSFDRGEILFSKDVRSLPDFILCDIDLGDPNLDGFQVLQELRAKNYQGSICVHSNRTLPQDFKQAMDLGAQAFLPKPISREHLLKFIMTNLNRITGAETTAAVKPLVIVLDDDVFFQFAWEQMLGQEADVLTFDFPERLRERLELDPNLLHRTCCIITDYYFGKHTVSETEFGNIISQFGFKGPVLLSSNSVEEVNDVIFTGRIAKDPISLTELKKYF